MVRGSSTRAAAWANFVSQLASDEDAATAYAKELVQAPSGWGDALQRLWDHIMRADKEGGPPGDPLTPLTARLLLSACEPQGKQPPKITKAFLLSLLANPAELRAACKTIPRASANPRADGRSRRRAAHQAGDCAARRAVDRARRPRSSRCASCRRAACHRGGCLLAGGAAGFMPTVVDDAESCGAAVRPPAVRRPRGVRTLVELLAAEPASRFGDHRVMPARFRVDTSGRRVFTEHHEDAQRPPLESGRSPAPRGGAGGHPAKMPLRTMPSPSASYAATTRRHKYGAVGALNRTASYAAARHDAHAPCGELSLVARGSAMQLAPPTTSM